jgi:hypothetical protein
MDEDWIACDLFYIPWKHSEKPRNSSFSIVILELQYWKFTSKLWDIAPKHYTMMFSAKNGTSLSVQYDSALWLLLKWSHELQSECECHRETCDASVNSYRKDGRGSNSGKAFPNFLFKAGFRVARFAPRLLLSTVLGFYPASSYPWYSVCTPPPSIHGARFLPSLLLSTVLGLHPVSSYPWLSGCKSTIKR